MNNDLLPTTPAVMDGAQISPAGADDFSSPAYRARLRDELRREEWALHKELIEAARTILQNFRENPHRTTLADVPRMAELASRLARLATEPDELQPEVPDTSVLVAEFKVALKKVYGRRAAEGRPLPSGPAIDAESAVITPAAPQP